MSPTVLFIKLLLVRYATQSEAEIRASCNEDLSLKCPGVDTDTMDFLSVTWYKLNDKVKHGIIRKGKGDKDTQYYNFSRSAEFGEKHSLFLCSVTPKDSGTYECSISANVGGQNMNPQVVLTIDVCVTQPDLTTVTKVLNSNEPLCHNQDLPVMWSIMGYVAVGLAKIILSLICIWVIQAFRRRSSKRQQNKW